MVKQRFSSFILSDKVGDAPQTRRLGLHRFCGFEGIDQLVETVLLDQLVKQGLWGLIGQIDDDPQQLVLQELREVGFQQSADWADEFEYFVEKLHNAEFYSCKVLSEADDGDGLDVDARVLEMEGEEVHGWVGAAVQKSKYS